jgi:GGDEF domain-containing protein
VLSRPADSPDDALSLAQRIGKLMREPIVLDGRWVTLSASIGIPLYPEDGTDPATRLQHTDTAGYHAKNSGRDTAQIDSASLAR